MLNGTGFDDYRGKVGRKIQDFVDKFQDKEL